MAGQIADEDIATETPTPFLPCMLRMALRHHQAGRLLEAARIYRRILAIDAEHADTLHLLGMIGYQAGSYDFAIAMIRKAITINPKNAFFYSNLGTVLQAMGKINDAAACYERALILQPCLAEVHVNRGNIFQARGDFDAAIARYEHALALKPEFPEAHYNLGTVLHIQDELEKAVSCYERALAINPRLAKAHYHLGCALRSLGDVDGAIQHYRSALRLQPNYPQATFKLSLAQLLIGDFSAGWHSYEQRWQCPPEDHDTPMRVYRQPLWRGEKLATGQVLIWGEQGVGDEIMYAGLIPDVLRTGNRCALSCDPRLEPLFRRSFPTVEIVGCRPENDPANDPSLGIAAHLPCGSLPGLFRTTYGAFARVSSPYLKADQEERDRFRVRYADGRRLIGLAWHTNNRKTGRSRSIELSLLAPLFAHSGVRWVSLQYGDRDVLQQQLTAARAPVLIDHTVDQFSNIDMFAAQVAAMDLVITIDNSTAHLAGALGAPTWVLLPFAADWRWFQAREDTPWYRSLRLFRQPRRGDWPSVVQHVESFL